MRLPIGRQGGPQHIQLKDSASFGTVVHEMGHTIGLFHEQSRADRNDFIEVRVDNIDPVERHNFEQEIRDGIDLGPYDFGSIMHYNEKAFSINNQPTIVPKVPIAAGGHDGPAGAIVLGRR